jgi:hypothetical protein
MKEEIKDNTILDQSVPKENKALLFSVFITYKNNPPTLEDVRIGGEVSKEFFDIIGPDAEGFPDCIESVIIKRSE